MLGSRTVAVAYALFQAQVASPTLATSQLKQQAAAKLLAQAAERRLPVGLPARLERWLQARAGEEGGAALEATPAAGGLSGVAAGAGNPCLPHGRAGGLHGPTGPEPRLGP